MCIALGHDLGDPEAFVALQLLGDAEPIHQLAAGAGACSRSNVILSVAGADYRATVVSAAPAVGSSRRRTDRALATTHRRPRDDRNDFGDQGTGS